MNRRGFLASLLAAPAAALAFDPERALWVPGKKLISVPAPSFDYEAQFWRAEEYLQQIWNIILLEQADDLDRLLAANYHGHVSLKLVPPPAP